MFPILRRQSPSQKFTPLTCPFCGEASFECDGLLPDTFEELMETEIWCSRCGWEGPVAAIVEEGDVQTSSTDS